MADGEKPPANALVFIYNSINFAQFLPVCLKKRSLKTHPVCGR
ncbi:hypothetical protein DCCM_4810 [Desulfocucumis palustris]|uniref:Uncharacterized protein n=1 Tax=Desulfocucumis palustris TaxID=1898651 RepID=A0A2L2XNY1_9FIRM|nr:hypothetical protein DCCM_4810 [Desulfocucumis palustris]